MFNLVRPGKVNKKRKVLGRGSGSGLGKTSGRGQKGQRARNSSPRPGFEGGQTPLYRRLPRRGFSNCRYGLKYKIVSLGDIDKKFKDGQLVNNNTLIEVGLISKKVKAVKILANGKLTKKVVFEVSKISKAAENLVVQVGCNIVKLV